MSQRYYWLKLKDDFFTSKRIKKLRNIAGGDTYTIIYLKMQLLALKTDGVIRYTGLENTFAEELALDLDESPDDVGITLSYLSSVGLMETSDNINYLLPYVVENTGSEGSSAQRMRDHRERKLSQCDTGVTHLLQVGDVEKEIEIEKEKEIDREKKRMSDKFTPPTISEVSDYCNEKGYSINAERFVDFYASKGWMVGKNKMKDWRAAVRNWASRDKVDAPSSASSEWINDAVEQYKRRENG